MKGILALLFFSGICLFGITSAKEFTYETSCYDDLDIQVKSQSRSGYWTTKMHQDYRGNYRVIEVEPGETYQIRLTNVSSWRVAAKVTVDGVNVLGPGDKKWVIDSHSDILIKGWQRDMTTAAEFRVDDRDYSYARYLRSMGFPIDLRQIGTIEVTFFRDQDSWDCYNQKREPDDWFYAPRAAGEQQPMVGKTKSGANKPGTGVGDTVYSPIQQVRMRVGESVKRIKIRYEYEERRYKTHIKGHSSEEPQDDIGWGTYLDR